MNLKLGHQGYICHLFAKKANGPRKGQPSMLIFQETLSIYVHLVGLTQVLYCTSNKQGDTYFGLWTCGTVRCSCEVDIFGTQLIDILRMIEKRGNCQLPDEYKEDRRGCCSSDM